MMKIDEVNLYLKESLDPILQQRGFGRKGSGLEYVRKINDWVNEFTVVVTRRGDFFIIDDGASIGMARVVKLFNKLEIEKWGVNETFAHLSLQSLGRGLYKGWDRHSLELAAAGLQSDFINIALDFYADNMSIVTLSRFLNRFFEHGQVPESVQTACFSLCLAWINDDPRLDDLAMFYYTSLKRTQGCLADPIMDVLGRLNQRKTELEKLKHAIQAV